MGDVPVTALPPGDVLGSKRRKVKELWYLADDPAASQPVGIGGGVSGSNAIAGKHLPVFVNITFLNSIFTVDTLCQTSGHPSMLTNLLDSVAVIC